MGFWAKSVAIFNSLCGNRAQSLRQVAHLNGFSKSSVHRLKQSMERRDRHPESWLWETDEGHQWLRRLVAATLYTFGLKRGVGAESIGEFFVRLRLERHVGCSPSALRTVMDALERLILETAAAWEKEGIAHGEIRPVIGAVDETFLQRMMLVFMDLCSGYLLMEEVAADRGFETWYDRANDRLKTLGTAVLYLVSDRAKALIKLAQTGLGCLSIPDVFHLSHDLATGSSLAIFGRLRQAKQTLAHAKQRLETLQKNAQAEHGHIEQAQALVAESETSVNHWQGVRRTWKAHLSNVSRILHPWRLADASRQTSQEVEEQLRAELQALERLLKTNGLPMKKDTLDKVGKQLAGLSALVDFWWQTVRQDMAQMAMTPRWTTWVEDSLLPLMYWQEKLRRTRCRVQKAQIALVLQAMEDAFERHACTRQLQPEVLASWKAWAGDHARAFQRASSAVEGRNGSLSQMQHNHRGLPMGRYLVWTVLHNFDCRAADGTTPASRFFRRSFPDLFESVLSQVDELPIPRQRRQAIAVSD
jgi:hypothetical protein